MAVNEKGEIIRKKNPQTDTSNDKNDGWWEGIYGLGYIITLIIFTMAITEEMGFFFALILAAVISLLWPLVLIFFICSLLLFA